jgi:signal transduction histidine kinase
VLSLIAEEKWYTTLDQETKKYFEILARNCRDMLHLIDDISDANLLSRGFFVLDKEEVKLKKYLEDLAEFCRLLAAKKEIQVSLEMKDLPETAQFDSFRMKQVIVNLVTNAIKFSSPMSKVWLRAELVVPNQLKFSVIDQGQGIPQEEVPLLFHEYSRTSVKPTNGEKSIGLGLSIIKKIVEAHGGQVSVSTKLGAGSKFSVIIPSSTLKPKKETEWSQLI